MLILYIDLGIILWARPLYKRGPPLYTAVYWYV
jgi:hypothetical protein